MVHAGPGQAQGEIFRRGDRLRHPATVFVAGKGFKPTGNILVDLHEQGGLGGSDTADGLAVTGNQDGLDLTNLAGLNEAGHVEGDERALRIGLVARRPVFLDRNDQLAVMKVLDGGLGRNRQHHRLATLGQHPPSGFKERIGFRRHHVDRAAIVFDAEGEQADIGLIPAQHFGGIGERCTPLPAIGGNRIARLGGFLAASGEPDENGIFVNPGHAALGFRRDETVLDKAARGDIEFTAMGRIASAIGQGDDAPVIVRPQAIGTAPHPVGTFFIGQRIQVQDHVPVGIIRQIAVQRGPPPKAVGIRRILPEIVDEAALIAAIGDAVIALINFQRRVVEILIARIALQALERALILAARPFDGALTIDLFQPEARVILRINLDNIARRRRVVAGRRFGSHIHVWCRVLVGSRARTGRRQDRNRSGGKPMAVKRHGENSPKW